ncbi:hypothetical protein ACOZ4N_15765 [Halorientalis pallida]|uniref:hypothetical protein n=1 Tax=Halorientalis pallida TaxID=2479928 RepID=UPI003C6F7AC5
MHWELVVSAVGIALCALVRDRASTTARATAPVVAVPLFVGPASASAADQVGTVACQLGVGDLVTFAIAALAVFHIVKGAITATVAFDKLGSARADRQRQGRRAMIGALQVTAGAVFPVVVGAIFTVVLDFELGACIYLV